MIRTHYALPETEKDCNAVRLVHCDVVSGTVEVQGGTATVDPATTIPDPETFAVERDVRASVQTVADPAHFHAWYAEQEHSLEDTPAQQVVSALMKYLWLQRRGLLPNA